MVKTVLMLCFVLFLMFVVAEVAAHVLAEIKIEQIRNSVKAIINDIIRS